MDAIERGERLIEAAAAVLIAAPNNRLNIVVLNKALFYLDLASLRDTAKTITGNSYIAIQQGPVVSKYPKRLVLELEARGIGKQVSEWNGAKPVILEKHPEHFQYLDADAMALVSSVTAFFAESTSQRASQYSHENPGWKLAWSQFLKTNKPCAIDLRIALQQIVEDDPWLDVPLLDDEEILAAADEGVGEDW